MTGPVENPWLNDLAAYVPGKSGAAGVQLVAKLSSNENPMGPSPAAVAAMQAAMTATHRYADGGSVALRQALAEHHGLEVDRIICGTGSDELLYIAAMAYAAPGDEVLYVRHGFMVYPLAAMRVGAVPIAAPDRAYTADVDAILERVTPRTRLVYIANPNNPTGTCIGRGEIERLQQGLPETVLLVLDGAYAEYVGMSDYESGLALARTCPNVLHTRTFSKLYGLAAERIGWGYASASIVHTLNKIRAPFNVTAAGQAGAAAALRDSAWTAKGKAHNDKWRPWLAAELSRLGLHVVPSEGNFVLARVDASTGTTAASLSDALAAKGCFVRHLPKQGLPDCLRVSVGLEAELGACIDLLRAELGGV